MGVSADRGGDPNQRDKNRNAGLVDLGEILGDIPVPDAVYDLTELNLTVKAKGAIIDLYADGDIDGKRLPDDFDLDDHPRPRPTEPSSVSAKAGSSSTAVVRASPRPHWRRCWQPPGSPGSCSTSVRHSHGGRDMAEMNIKRRPIRAALYGLMLGFSIWYFLQFQFAVFSLDSTGGVITKAVIVIVAVMALSVVWAYVAPPKKPKGAQPTAAPAAAVTEAPAMGESAPAEPAADAGEATDEPALPSARRVATEPDDDADDRDAGPKPVKALTVLLGLPAALVAGVIVFFTYGEIAGVAVLVVWLILLFTSVAVMPRAALARDRRDATAGRRRWWPLRHRPGPQDHHRPRPPPTARSIRPMRRRWPGPSRASTGRWAKPGSVWNSTRPRSPP